MTARDATTNWGTAPDWLPAAEAAGITPACRGEDLALFFPDSGHGALAKTNQAKRICASCLLLRTCREWALDQPPHLLHGVWGGTTHAQRLAGKPKGEQPPQFRKTHN